MKLVAIYILVMPAIVMIGVGHLDVRQLGD